jgi:hypothetical protein
MSKKLAIGGSHLLLDVKFGSGAFMKTVEQAQTLAEIMVKIGNLAGIHTVAAITSMEQPLGCAIGNALEIAEAIAVLRGEGSPDVSLLCFQAAQELLIITGKACNTAEAKHLVHRAISSGAAAAKDASCLPVPFCTRYLPLTRPQNCVSEPNGATKFTLWSAYIVVRKGDDESRENSNEKGDYYHDYPKFGSKRVHLHW